jgi:hypothetical protein
MQKNLALCSYCLTSVTEGKSQFNCATSYGNKNHVCDLTLIIAMKWDCNILLPGL